MRYSARQYAQALIDSLESTDKKDQDQILDNFVYVLNENHDLRQFEEIASEFHKLQLTRKGIKTVDITSAHPISKDNEESIIKELNKIVKGDLELRKRVDENVIGGVVIRVDDQMLDATVKNNLEQLKIDLTN